MPSTPVFFKTDDVPCLANGAFVIASLGITPDGEIGYIVHPDVWGFGVAKEAIRALVKTWFETLPNEKQVKACVDVTNVTSSGLLKKLGFVEAGREDYDSVEMGESVLITWLIANETAKNWKDSVKKD
jgi:RimJ/RimL family protein N-acetyltransferase